jgi:hypothetical protein
MRKFSKKIGVYILLSFLLVVVLEGVYTLIFSNSELRNKVQFVMNAQPKKYDAIIMGSSRAENHIIPKMFQERGLSAYNFGMGGGGLCDDSLLLKLFFEKGNTTDKLFLQVDLQFMGEIPAPAIQATFLPFFTTNPTIYNHYKDNTENAFALAFFPFYRYCKLDSKIGFRELVLTVMNKKGKFYDTNGFIALDNTLNPSIMYNLPTEVSQKNNYYNEIKAICKKNKVQLIPFMAPFCPYVYHADFFAKLKQNVPELHDYSNAIKGDNMFSACGHMNRKGAEVFTTILLEKHFESDGLMK